LSKNGYDVTLDEALNNNLGTLKELAETVVAGTDWDVETDFFVQTIEENLVYLKTR
jgi:hypothetical protein